MEKTFLTGDANNKMLGPSGLSPYALLSELKSVKTYGDSAALMGHFFTRNHQAGVSFSTKISLNMGLFLQNFQKFWVFAM